MTVFPEYMDCVVHISAVIESIIHCTVQAMYSTPSLNLAGPFFLSEMHEFQESVMNIVKHYEKIDDKWFDLRLDIIFTPTDRSKASEATVLLRALRIKKSVDSCMAVKNCLSMLGDGSNAAGESQWRLFL